MSITKVGSSDVSVIIPVFNRVAHLARCLDSLIYQTYKSFEVIIIDDGSQEDIYALTRKYICQLNILYRKIPNSGGPARPRNIGLDHAKSQFIAFLDSDDYWHPEKLEISIASMDRNTDFVYHDLYRVRLENPSKQSSKDIVKSSKIYKNAYTQLLRQGNVIPNSSVLVRKTAFANVGYFCEEKSFIAVEDYDMWIRLAKNGCRFKRIPTTLGYYESDNFDSISSPKIIQRRLENYKSLSRRYFFYNDNKVFPAFILYQYAETAYHANMLPFSLQLCALFFSSIPSRLCHLRYLLKVFILVFIIGNTYIKRLVLARPD